MTESDRSRERSPAEALQDLHALLIEGGDVETLARAALTTARATAPTRRVAIFDLAGAFAATPGQGLVSALREGRSLNHLARPIGEGGREWFVVGRGPEPADDAVVSHERWPKLVAGFRSAGALLIILVPRELSGGSRLMELADRAVSLPPAFEGYAEPDPEVPPSEPDTAADENDDDLALPPIVLTHPPEPPQPPRRVPRAVVVFGALCVVLVAVLSPRLIALVRPPSTVPDAEAVADSVALAQLVADSALPAPAVIPDTLPVAIVANPADSSLAAVWGVELVATNDRADANLRLASAGTALSAGTLSPVLLGSDPLPLYKVVGGAFTDRAAAERLRDQLRASEVLSPETGMVARVPYAIRLDTALSLTEARVRAREWAGRGTAAYALVADDGRATVYAGAFASPEQAVLLLAALRDDWPAAVIAFRVGRSF